MTIAGGRALIIYHGGWPSYDWSDVHHKWNQMIEGPLRSYGGVAFSGVRIGRSRDTEPEDIQRTIDWISFWCPSVVLLVEHGDGMENEMRLYETLWRIRTPAMHIFSFWPDCTTDADIRHAEQVAPYVHGIINLDRDVSPRGVVDEAKYINRPGAYGRQWFYDDHRKRKYPLTFIGEYRGRSEREPIIQAVRNAGIRVITSDDIGLSIPGDHASRSSIVRYADALRDSVMTLNIPPHPTYPILNGRIWEGMACGACIVNIDFPGSPMRRLFEPGKEYISIGDPSLLADTLYPFINAPERAMSIARRGSKSYWKKYPPESFWRDLIRYVG